MINSDPGAEVPDAEQDTSVRAIMRSGARGAVVLAGLATAGVAAIWLVFYLFVFVPRAIAL